MMAENKILNILKKNSPSVKESVYGAIDLNSLIAFSSYLLEKKNIPLTFENIYVMTYLTFPKKFCLVGFPEFPDGARINRAILQCLPKYQNLMIGKATSGYKLTVSGLSRAEEVGRRIKLKYVSGKNKKNAEISKRTLDYNEKIKELSLKPSFKKFLDGRYDEISVDGIFDFLEVSPYSGKKQVKSRISRYQSLAKYGKSKKLKEFLRFIMNMEEFRAYIR